MDNLFLYLLKVSAGTTLLYLFYLLLFSKDTFYLRNRIILILILLLPTIIPVLKVQIHTNSVVPSEPISSIDNIISQETAFETTMSGTINSFNYNKLFVFIYFTITGLLLLRGIISLISTHKIIKKGVVKISQFPKVIISDIQLPPFSFFPYVVIPAENYKSGNYIDILDHEFAHIRQGHTFDLLLSELYIAFQWFNPFVWLIKRSIILNHEYLADHVSVGNKSVKEYQYRLLNFQPGLKNISLAHNFNSLIKNRIIMINKKPTRRYATLKNILILPVVAIVAYAFVTPEYHYVAPATGPVTIYQAPVIIQKEVKGIVLKEDGKPLEKAIIVVKGTSMGVSTYQDGRFSLEYVPEDGVLVVSYIGYKTKVIKPLFKEEMTIKMERDTLNLEKLNNLQATPPPPVGTAGSVKNEPLQLPMSLDTRGNIIITKDKYLKIRSEDGKTPLVLVDGIVTDINTIKIDPETVESMGVYKEGTGIKKFGDMGKGDIVEIITRKDGLKSTGDKISFFEVVKTPLDNVNPDMGYVAVEEMPQFPGGNEVMFQWLSQNLRYPADAIDQKIEGIVKVRFLINSEGKVDDIVALRSENPILNNEAIRLINSMPDWKPGSQNGKKVDVYYMVPVTFSLPKPE